jgi:hypothetical protein
MKPTSTRGKRDALVHPSLSGTAIEALHDNAVEEVRQLAREHERDALDTIIDIMDNKKTSPSVRRACARDVLELALDRKIGAPNPMTAAANSSGLTINILNLTDGSTPETKDFIKTKDIAAEIIAGADEAIRGFAEEPRAPQAHPPQAPEQEVAAPPRAAASVPDWKP